MQSSSCLLRESCIELESARHGQVRNAGRVTTTSGSPVGIQAGRSARACWHEQTATNKQRQIKGAASIGASQCSHPF